MENNMKLHMWNLRDIILASLIGLLFAAICLSTVLFTIGPFEAALAPIGLGGLGFEIVFGIFFMSAIFAPYIIQKPGVALVVGYLTGLIQVFLGSPFAATVPLSGLIQGLGAEIGFAIFKYRRFDMLSIGTAALGATITSFILAYCRGTWQDIAMPIIAMRFGIRFVSALFLGGVVGKFLADRLAKAGVLKSSPLGAGISHDIESE
jgi:energy-coupling factor transport system substrate-specific component